jgi:mono/diheme cytochrome c family protein
MSSSGKLMMRKILFVALLGVIVLVAVLALRGPSGPWVVPDEAKRRANPVQPSATVLNAARTVYMDRCAHCHGFNGRGDGVDAQKHNVKPTNFTDAAGENARTDGELFYQISEGRRPMPGFASRLSEEQRWELVLLIRSFSGSMKVPGDAKAE